MAHKPATGERALAIIGAQWGDEGKGKIVDLLCDGYDLVVRYQGGNNAGHTVQVGDATYKLHLIPSGILKGKRCALGNGTVIDPEGLLAEMDALPASCPRSLILVSDRAHVVLAYHKLLDWAHEAHDARNDAGAGAIGTTLKGIGPAYASKVRRSGAVRVADLLDERRLAALLAQQDGIALRELSGLVGTRELREKAASLFPHLCGAGPGTLFDPTKTLAHYLALARRLAPHVRDTATVVNEAARSGQRVLFEGAQGALLDVDHGTYPYVTSSSTTRGGIYSGSGFGGHGGLATLGIVKAYTTRVGAGPFPTELTDVTGERLASRGHEVGTTTGRKRRCGWLDAVALRYVQTLCGFSSLAVTKLDVLSGIRTLRICVGYAHEGKEVSGFPADPDVLGACVPAYEELQGWDEDISGVRSYEGLPSACRSYLARIELLVGVPITLVSVGPERTQTISRE